MSAERVFVHTGDIGDVIAALPVIRAMGGGRLIFRNHNQCGRNPLYRPMEGARFEALRPLLLAQDYITSTAFDPKARGDHDFTHFRRKYHQTKCLTMAHAEYMGLSEVDMTPWLKVEPSPRSAGRVVVARSARYQNRHFPWRSLAAALHPKMLFVGLPEEHEDFQRYARFPVEYVPTPDFLTLAQLIAGSERFIGNQSSPCWVAMGLGHSLIQETARGNPDSVVPRWNAQFVRDGRVII